LTTLFDISLKVVQLVTDVLDGLATDGSATYLKDTLNLTQNNQYWDKGTLWIRSGTHTDKVVNVTGFLNSKLNFNTLGSALCVLQVETATVLGTVTGNGNATVIVTAAGLNGSPKTLSVAVLNLDSASDVGGKIRTALNADSDILNFFTVGGSGATVSLTSKVAVANDTTLNISIANGTCTGLTAAPTSTNTTAGVAGPEYSVIRAAYPWRQIVSNIRQALDETHVTGDDDTLIGDGETLEFTLPTGVYDIKRVEFERVAWEERLPSHHWKEINGAIRFDYGYAPVDDDVIHLIYRDQHPALSTYATVISDEINLEWLKFKAAEKLLIWGLGQYRKDPEYMIEERMNIVLNNLRGKSPRRDAPEIMMHTAGG
jgi:hypothetical protein